MPINKCIFWLSAFNHEWFKLHQIWLFSGFLSSILNANVWLLDHSCNLRRICCLHESWRGFIYMLMPRGGILAVLPARYYFDVYFMLLTVTSQQGAHPREQDHACVSDSIAVSICCVKQELLTGTIFNVTLWSAYIHSRGDKTWCGLSLSHLPKAYQTDFEQRTNAGEQVHHNCNS